jgi:hypothetical protein
MDETGDIKDACRFPEALGGSLSLAIHNGHDGLPAEGRVSI